MHIQVSIRRDRCWHLLFLPAVFLAAGCSSASNTDSKVGQSESGPGFPGAPLTATGLINGEMECYYDVANPGGPPVATVESAIESIESEVVGQLVHVRVTLSPSFCDNTYGANSIGWTGKKGHTFEHLVKSDRINIDLSNGEGSPVLQPTLDYLSSDGGQGFQSLGVWDAEGAMRAGDIAAVLDASSSMDRNLNEHSYTDYLVDSPATDDSYTPNPLTPNWDYRMIYEVWVALDAFGSSGFGEATVDYVHCSPAKGENTVVVEPDPCPPDWGADCQGAGCDSEEPVVECNDPDGCGSDTIIE